MKKRSFHKGLRITAIVLLFVVALNALAAGYSFMTTPSGEDIGISTDYLRPSAPFNDYFIPGLFLFLVNGVLSLVVAVFGITKQKHFAALMQLQGCILVGWIILQLTMVTTIHPLHFIIVAIGFLLIWIGRTLNQSTDKTTLHKEMDSPAGYNQRPSKP